MSVIISAVLNCDYPDCANCIEDIDLYGYERWEIEMVAIEKEWLVKGGNHYCPEHKEPYQEV